MNQKRAHRKMNSMERNVEQWLRSFGRSDRTNTEAGADQEMEIERKLALSGTKDNATAGRGTMARRSFLMGGLGVLGAGLGAGLFSHAFSKTGGKLLATEQADITKPSPIKSVIFINLAGGASHVDSLDPKRGNGPFGQVATRIRGVNLSDRLPLTAKELHRVSLVRSLYSQEGDHGRASHLLHSGHRMLAAFADIPSFGSVIAYAKHKANQPYFPEHITLGGRNDIIGRGGFLGTKFDSFHIGNVKQPLSNITPHRRVSEAAFYRREQIVDAINANFAGRVASGETKVWREMHASALEFMNSDRLKIFDLNQEAAAQRQRFGDTNMGNALLMAKRLAAAEVPFIEITMGGWDTHNNNRAQLTNLLGQLDQPMAALLGELGSSGLLSQTLFVLNTEFGRTPNIASNGDGRDHYPRAWSAILGGGNIPAGQVYGETDEKGAQIVKGAVHGKDFTATIYEAAGINSRSSLYTSVGRPMQLIEDPEPIQPLLPG